MYVAREILLCALAREVRHTHFNVQIISLRQSLFILQLSHFRMYWLHVTSFVKYISIEPTKVQLLPTKKAHTSLICLTVTLETLVVPVEPGSTLGTSLDIVGTVSTLAQTTALASSASKTSTFSVLVHRVHNPVNTSIVTDLRVGRIYKNNFVIFHGSVLVYPV